MKAAMELLIGCIGAFGLWNLWFYAMKNHRTSELREELFTLRDQLFLAAAKGHVSFQHPAYVELRQRLNDMARFAPHVTLMSLIFATRYSDPRATASQPFDTWRQSLVDLPDDVRSLFEDTQRRMLMAFTKHLIEGSITLLTLSTICLIPLRALVYVRTFLGSRAKPVNARQRVILEMAEVLDVDSLARQAYSERGKKEELDLQLA